MSPLSSCCTGIPSPSRSPLSQHLPARVTVIVLGSAAHGEEMKPIGEYLQGKCMRLIEYVVLDADRTGWVKRFTNTASSHAAVTAAVSGDIYALSVSGSDFAYGTTPDLADSMEFTDDISGSAAYKKYLAKTVFTLGR